MQFNKHKKFALPGHPDSRRVPTLRIFGIPWNFLSGNPVTKHQILCMNLGSTPVKYATKWSWCRWRKFKPVSAHVVAKKPFLFVTLVWDRVARWHIFKPRIPIWVNFGGSYSGRCWYILRPFGLFCCHTVYFMAIWYILWPFGVYFPTFLYATTRKIWQPWFESDKNKNERP
jgi:hypothetical protein